MKTFFIPLLIISISLSAHAQQSCPLTNSKLTDLRSAASKLAKNITLSSECRAYQDTINQTNAQLRDLAYTIADADGKLAPNERPDFKDTAAKAVSQLDTISTLFKDQRCGAQLVGFLDYANAFVDIATSMTPFLARYGGPEAMPWVLGSAIAGAGAKTLIMFFKNKSIDMRNPDQSNTFLKNSCSFYHLNQIKESLDDLEMKQSPTIQIKLRETENRLKKLKARPLSEPQSEVALKLQQADKDQGRIKYLQEQMKLDSSEGCSYIKSYAAKEDADETGSLLERVWENYERTIIDSEFRLGLEKKFFIDELNPAVATTIDVSRCNKWLLKMNLFSDVGLAALKKEALEDKEIKAYEAWKSEQASIEEDIKMQKSRIKFFDELTGNGFNIEFSEIIRSHKQVQDSIFESYRWLKTLKMKGLGEAWLRVKLEDSEMDMEAFKFRYKEVQENIASVEKVLNTKLSKEAVLEFNNGHVSKNNREHPLVFENTMSEVCTQLSKTWTSWYNGLIHAKAGRDYCVTFQKVINKLDYPQMQTLCFGATKRRGKKLLRSLRNQIQEFQNIKPEADSILMKMKEYSCKESADMTNELLTRPI